MPSCQLGFFPQASAIQDLFPGDDVAQANLRRRFPQAGTPEKNRLRVAPPPQRPEPTWLVARLWLILGHMFSK